MARVLVCAPCDSAIDEIVLRLRAEAERSPRQLSIDNMVVLGRGNTLDKKIRELTLEYKVDNEYPNEPSENIETILYDERQDLIDRRAKIRLTANKANNVASAELQSSYHKAIESLTRQIIDCGHFLEDARETRLEISMEAESLRHKNEVHVLKNAEVICATVHASGHPSLRSLGRKFDAIIIDDAHQCTELSSLIPLQYESNSCVMLGDITMRSTPKSDVTMLYRQSLYERMVKKFPSRPSLLQTQHRMHPDISRFLAPCYQEVVNNDSAAVLKYSRPWHRSYFTPYRFFDVMVSPSQGEFHSNVRMAEVQIALQLFKALLFIVGSKEVFGKIAILAPFKEQVSLLKSVFDSQLGETTTLNIAFKTIEEFRGRETDIVILSSVRAEPDTLNNDGYIEDSHRLAIGLTRARMALWIVGTPSTLMQSNTWRLLIENAKLRQLYSYCRPRFLDFIYNLGPKDINRLPPAPVESFRAKLPKEVTAVAVELPPKPVVSPREKTMPAVSSREKSTPTTNQKAVATSSGENALKRPRGDGENKDLFANKKFRGEEYESDKRQSSYSPYNDRHDRDDNYYRGHDNYRQHSLDDSQDSYQYYSEEENYSRSQSPSSIEVRINFFHLTYPPVD